MVRDKNSTIEEERTRIWEALRTGISVWCPDCTEMHDMIQMEGEFGEHCFEEKCSGRFIVLPYNEVFPFDE